MSTGVFENSAQRSLMSSTWRCKPWKHMNPTGAPRSPASRNVSADGVGHALALGPQAGVESHRAERTLGDEEMREGVHAAAADGGVGEAASDEASGVAVDGVGDVGVIETEVDGLHDQRAVHARGGAALEKSLGGGVPRARRGGSLPEE